MKRIAYAMALAAFTLVAAAAREQPDDATKQELDRLQGTWRIESFTIDGNKLDQEAYKDWLRIVDGQHIVWKRPGETMVELDIKIYPTQSPKELDSTIASGTEKGKILLAIYEWDESGDELRISFRQPGQPRPQKFESMAGSGVWLYTAKRVKDDE